MEICPLLAYLLLAAAGLAAGFVNTLAGGGSVFTLPLLMLLGLPADVANGTNRVGILLQCLWAVRGFDRRRLLDRQAAGGVLLPMAAGSAVGAAVASAIPPAVLKPVLLLTVLAMTAITVVRPGALPADGERPRTLAERPAALAWLFFAGLYGGFVQAGVGFILITALAGVLRYDLVRANALKMLCTLAITGVALAVFLARDQVRWLPGLVLGLGSMVGVALSVRFALRARQRTLKAILLAMAALVCGAALIK